MDYSKIKFTSKTKFQIYTDVDITMKDAEFIENLLNYELPEGVRLAFVSILNYMGYWDIKRKNLIKK